MKNGENIQQTGIKGAWSNLINAPFAGNKKTTSKDVVEDTIGDLPTTSTDTTCQAYLGYIERSGKMGDVKNYLLNTLNTPAKEYDSTTGFEADNPDYYAKLNSSLDYNDRDALLEYTGTRFAWINSVARGFWDYEKMGRRTPQLEAEIKSSISSITSAIDKSPAPEKDFVTFRGTNLSAFRDYDVRNIADLQKMKGQFMLEKGFTSTAIVREKSFVDKESSSLWVGSSNIEMRYHVPAGHHTGTALLSHDLSYSPEQTEYAINRNSLMYISEVSFDKPDHAIVDAVVVPKDVYDPNYKPFAK